MTRPHQDPPRCADAVVADSLTRLRRWVEARDFAGYDPYDALNSPLVRTVTRPHKVLRIAATQALRRLPVNLRPLLRVPPGHNPKGIGLFFWGYAKLDAMAGQQQLGPTARRLLGVLRDLRTPGLSGNGWGYNFDWQSRAFFIPKGTPTIVNSSFIGHALLDAFEWFGDEEARDLALPIADFILKDLDRLHPGEDFCFSYTPIDHHAVHNASMLGASLLVRIHEQTGNEEALQAALQAARYTLRHQRPDGAWRYSERLDSRWVDSFHTGFVLESLQHLLDRGLLAHERPDGQRTAREAFELGRDYYARTFFLDDGTPRYFHNATYPIDVHSPAEAIVFFVRQGPDFRELTDRVVRWTIEHMQSPGGSFYFRRGRRFVNPIPYMRWSQSWAFHALTEYRYRTAMEEA